MAGWNKGGKNTALEVLKSAMASRHSLMFLVLTTGCESFRLIEEFFVCFCGEKFEFLFRYKKKEFKTIQRRYCKTVNDDHFYIVSCHYSGSILYFPGM